MNKDIDAGIRYTIKVYVWDLVVMHKLIETYDDVVKIDADKGQNRFVLTLANGEQMCYFMDRVTMYTQSENDYEASK